MPDVSLINANAFQMPIESESVHCIVTSIPYWGLRKYEGGFSMIWGGDPGCSHQWDQVEIKDEGYTGRKRWQHGHLRIDEGESWETTTERHGDYCHLCGAWYGELGLEPTLEQFLENIVQVFREVKRVLRQDGTLWLNVGDLYATSQAGNTTWGDGVGSNKRYQSGEIGLPKRHIPAGLKPKDMVGLPWAVAFALRADGWWLRSDIIWHKTNPMPESIEDRLTKAHEYVFLMAKDARYYFDADAIKEPLKETSKARLDQPNFHNQKGGAKDSRTGHRSSRNALEGLKEKYERDKDGATKNKRTVWEIDDPLTDFVNFSEAQGIDILGLMDAFLFGESGDRPETEHEYLFLMSKNKSYYYDADAVREPNETMIKYPTWNLGGGDDRLPKGKTARDDYPGAMRRKAVNNNAAANWNPLGRNRRTVWTISTAPYKGAHFATYPPALVEPCILAGTSAHGVCPECGAPWERVIEHKEYGDWSKAGHREYRRKKYGGGNEWKEYEPSTTLGWQPTCDHYRTRDRRKREQQDILQAEFDLLLEEKTTDSLLRCMQMVDYLWESRVSNSDSPVVPATVLDPFVGSGTTLLVARNLKRNGIGVDLSFDYLKNQARKRLSLEQLDHWLKGISKSGNGSKPEHKNKQINRLGSSTQGMHAKRTKAGGGALPMFDDL